MSVQSAIKERRSIRSYSDTPVDDDKLTIVLEAARLSPSAGNRQKWNFIVVRDREIRERLANEASVLAAAPVVIAACATEAESVMPCGQTAGTVDTSIALSFMMLQAHELGLGTCWLGSFNEAAVKGILKIPAGVRVVAVTPLGYPAQSPAARPRKPLAEIVSFGRYGRSSDA
jgi:nitroreductase